MNTETLDVGTQAGTALDAALQAVDASLSIEADDKQQLVRTKVRGLMRGYDARWIDAGYVPFAVEEHIENPLTNIETQRTSRTFRVAGKLDVLAKYDGRTVLMDHKTTSIDITDPNGSYWRQLVVEAQPSSYMLQAWSNEIKIDSAVWDVIRKPSIRPAKIAKGVRALAVANRSYCGFPLEQAELDWLQTNESENVTLYEMRLADDCTVQRPEWYFQRKGVPRTDSELYEYAIELWEHGQEILHARNTKRHARNSGACMLYGSPCKFLGICSGHDSPNSDKWKVKECVHRELPKMQGDGRDALTNSRIRCFQTCRRKHFYEYEMGIEAQDEEEREALYMGTLTHIGLEAWWRFLMKENLYGNSSTGLPTNEVGSASGSV